MSRRVDCCPNPECGRSDRINQFKDKDGNWHSKCWACGWVDPNGYPTRKEARYAFNRLPRKHSVLTYDEYLAGTGQAWYQIPKRQRRAFFESHDIEYDPVKLVPKDPDVRRNTASMAQPMKRQEYKDKVARGEIKPNKKRKRKK